MSVLLEIRDGDPWYLSPDVWTVPGNDPEGPEGMPVAGRPCYMWARVRNNGPTAVNDATVRFYWANPAVGFDRSTANLVGISYVSLPAAESGEVLCLTPWVPQYVNEGHECILAEAFHETLDPLPATNAFNVPTDRHVAQRNLSVAVGLGGAFRMPFEVHNASRKEQVFRIAARPDKLKRLTPLARHLGRDFKMPRTEGKIARLGFVDVPCPDDEAWDRAVEEVPTLVLKGGQRAGLTLIGRMEGGAAVIQVEQSSGEQIVGGLSVLVLPQKAQEQIGKGGQR